MATLFRPLLVSLGLGVLGVLPVPASGALLASYTQPENERFPLLGTGALTLSVDLDLCLTPSYPCQGPVLFDALVLSAADAGSVFTATSATDPGFAAFAAYLTNGSSEAFYQHWEIPGQGNSNSAASGALESNAFAGAGSASSNGIDLFGFAIERVELEIGPDFTLTPIPGQFLDQTIIGGTITVRVFGNPVPEPATALFVGGGLLLLGSRRRAAR